MSYTKSIVYLVNHPTEDRRSTWAPLVDSAVCRTTIGKRQRLLLVYFRVVFLEHCIMSRCIEAGMSVSVLDETGGWQRVHFI